MKNILKFSFNSLILLSIIFSFVSETHAVPINAYIDNVSPNMNAVSASKYTNISIVFTQPMDPLSINNSNVKVFGYQTGLLTVNISYNAITKTATIDPDQDLKYGENIAITLTDRVKTSTNENITPFVYSFTVQAIAGNGIFVRSSGIDNIESAHIKAGDIDKDGDIDLLVNNKIYKNNGNAVFSFFSELNVIGIPELADFDSDGDLDILIQVENNVYFFQNNGLGLFIQIYTFLGRLGAFGDLNGDGYLDISYFASISDIATMNNNNGSFMNDTSVHFEGDCLNFGNYTDKVLTADFNNDGNLDIVGIHGRSNSGIFFEICRSFNSLKNDGSEMFTSNLIFSDLLSHTSSILFSWRDSKSFDYNNDGLIDIVSPDRILKNNENETFIGISSFGFSNSFSSDFNGDGFIDLLSTVPNFPLSTNLNEGTGNFAPAFTGNSGHFSNGATGDFNGDGDIDLAALNYDIHEVSILLNGDNPLPVELSSFASSVNSGTVTLSWSTATEENNSGFDVERRFAGEETQVGWNIIGNVAGHRNSATQQNYIYVDKNLSSGKYKYRLKQTDFNGNYKYYNLAGEVVIGVPEKFELLQNYPNPFNPNTLINYRLAQNNFVSLKVFDNSGKEIRSLVNEVQEAGYYSIDFNGSELASGIYFYRIQAGSFSETKKMFLIK